VHVPVISQKEVERLLVEKRKQELLDRYVTPEERLRAVESQQLVGME